MAAAELSYAAAAAGGALSFLSPCVLPLVPAYLCFVAGTTLDQLAGAGAGTEAGMQGSAAAADPALARRAVLASLAFIAGFSTIFILLGASASAISHLLVQHIAVIAKVAGVVIIGFGLHYMGLLRIALLNREARFSPKPRPEFGLLGAYVVGLAFAFGWTPCIGPILATILTIAASRQDLSYGVSLLAVYALGLGIPFFAAALAINPFLRFVRTFRRHLRKVEIGAGLLMVVTGLLIFLGSLGMIGTYLLDLFPALARIG